MIGRFELHLGDCLESMRKLADASVDSVVTDPPYGIRFMGKAWDGADIEAKHAERAGAQSHDPSVGPAGAHKSIAAEAGKYDLAPAAMVAFQEFSRAWAAEAFRVLKPGGHLLSFASARTYHRMACGIEEAGFDVRDQVLWLYGSGFPKSLNGEWGGTGLKPAHEPVAMARKPLIGTVAANYATFGTGALNIDGCRVHSEDSAGYAYTVQRMAPGADQNKTGKTHQEGVAFEGHTKDGRWPANLIHDGSEEVVALFPAEAGAQSPVKGTEPSAVTNGIYGEFNGRTASVDRADSGSAARFFYCAKASAADRHEGLPHPGAQFKQGRTPRDAEKVEAARQGNHHPTVKPTDLMRHLCRLVTPAGGVVLDPFMGSGSTGKAALLEGFRFIGCELDPDYMAIARARIENAALQGHQPSLLEAA